MFKNTLTKSLNWIRSHEKVSLFILVVIFVVIRLPGTSLPLHQDEYKWPLIANPANVSTTEIPHPPLSEFIYQTAGEIVGFNVHFRFVPLLFGALNLILLYYVLKRRFGKQIAAVGAIIFTFSYFSMLASLMVDTDGAVMPFFFLLMLWAYDIFRSGKSKHTNWWMAVALLAAILGLFVKVSFALAVGAIIADFLWEKRTLLKKRDVLRYGGYIFGFIVGFIILLILSQKLFPFFHLSDSVAYWEHFATGSRNWFQTFIQLMKAVLYSSPFLILVPLFISRKRLHELVSFVSYLIFGLIFYIILFDFSLGALDRYMQFIIIPLCVLCAVAVVDVFTSSSGGESKKKVQFLALGVLLALVIFATAYMPQYVPSLYPKSAWIPRIFSLHWDFLYPFSGGSGPLGFYISFGVMALSWVASLIFLTTGFFRSTLRKYVLLVLIPIGIMYNGMFIEEYLFGAINGSASTLLSHVVTFIQDDPDIHMVTVYNDNGGNEIQAIGKYRKRLYTSPEFDVNEKMATLNKYKEHYLEINVPRIDPESVYRKYLDSCMIVYKETDHYISATVYDCHNAPDISL